VVRKIRRLLGEVLDEPEQRQVEAEKQGPAARAGRVVRPCTPRPAFSSPCLSELPLDTLAPSMAQASHRGPESFPEQLAGAPLGRG
jgi:hypothetical protein